MPARRVFRTHCAPRVAVVSTIVILCLFLETHNCILSEVYRGVKDEAVQEICISITHTWEARLKNIAKVWKQERRRSVIFKCFAGTLETCSSPGEWYIQIYREHIILCHSAESAWTTLFTWVPVSCTRVWHLLAFGGFVEAASPVEPRVRYEPCVKQKPSFFA